MQIGKRLMLGFHGTKPGDQEVEKIAQYLNKGQLGGVILFGYNIESPEQVSKLNAYLKQAGGPETWIAVDQEGGRVQRLNSKNGFTDYRCPFQVAESMSTTEAYTYYRGMADELAQVGFNLNFGCVVDLHSLPGKKKAASPIIGGLYRSYGSDPKVVAAYATAFVHAHRDKGVTSCLKHYPGHGFAPKDSHKGMVDITDSYMRIEREPFDRMIAKGAADMIMSAHLMYRKLDPDYPVSLSEKIMPVWLRQEDDYQGLVITDDLHMGAIGQHYDTETVMIKALNAGNDILLYSNNQVAAQGVKDFKKNIDLPALFQEVVEKAVDKGELLYAS